MADVKEKVTVLYYEQDDMTSICSDVLTKNNSEGDSRVIFPREFRENKIIVAVMDGDCNLLNSLGDRTVYY